MATHSDRVELLAPAGNFEKLEIAIHYGADAVYVGGKEFSLRSFSGNFTLEEMAQAISLVHKHGLRLYVACNIYSRNNDQKAIADYLRKLAKLKPDGLIVADPAVLLAARQEAPGIPLHVSTQANTTNHVTARFWKTAGACRVNAARELSLAEIREMVEKAGIAVEVFVHGAMCIAYSGRCLLSSFLAGRDGNRGLCAQACRWRYTLIEEKRPGHYMPVAEDGQGVYIFNSKDLCMIRHIPDLIRTGVASLKIEGRMKGIHYLASVVKTYREAVDAYYQDPLNYRVKPRWVDELEGVTRRGYCTGFYFGNPAETVPDYQTVARTENRQLVGKILGNVEQNRYSVEVRNTFHLGDRLEGLSPEGPPRRTTVSDIRDAAGIPLERAVPGTPLIVTLDKGWKAFDLLRKSLMPRATGVSITR